MLLKQRRTVRKKYFHTVTIRACGFIGLSAVCTASIRIELCRLKELRNSPGNERGADRDLPGVELQRITREHEGVASRRSRNKAAIHLLKL
jgi:hypothetical protein